MTRRRDDDFRTNIIPNDIASHASTGGGSWRGACKTHSSVVYSGGETGASYLSFIHVIRAFSQYTNTGVFHDFERIYIYIIMARASVSARREPFGKLVRITSIHISRERARAHTHTRVGASSVYFFVCYYIFSTKKNDEPVREQRGGGSERL